MNPESTFRVAAELGFGSVEVMVTPAPSTHDPRLLKDLVQRFQIPVNSVHAPTLLLCKFVFGTHPHGKALKSLELADQVGAETVVVHPPFQSNPYARRLLESTRELNSRFHAQVAVENMFPYAIRGHSKIIYGPSYEETIESGLPLTLDFSHASLSGLNPVEVAKTASERIRMVHLTDGTTRLSAKGDSIRDEHLLPGEGEMPLEETFQVLRASNWAGAVTLEVNTRSAKTDDERDEMLMKSLRFYNERLRG